ncbi:MAG TPA: FAD binding domain-containing protein [Acidimicrobiia bacterium]
MKPAPFEYVRPATVGEAIGALAADENAKLIAGGQSLVPLMALRLARPSVLVDVADLGLEVFAVDDGELRIGAAVTHRRLERDATVAERMPLLREAVALIGYPAIRVRGTVGGSLAHADPVAELPAVLVAARGSVIVHGPRGARTVAAPELFEGFLTTSIEPDEVLVEVRVPLPGDRHGAAFCEWSPRAGDFATAGIAVIVERSESGECTAVRAAACGLADVPDDCSDHFAGMIGARAPSDPLLRDLARRFGDHDLHGLLAARALFRAASRSGETVAA